MKTLWFQNKYVESILSGEKTETIRKVSIRNNFEVGQQVQFTVGPRPAFAIVEILSCENVAYEEITEKHADAIEIYGVYPEYRIIKFKVIENGEKK